MTQLQQNRYDQLLRRIGDLKGPGSKVNEVLEELFPILDVENAPPELLALSGWRTAWQSTERLSAAGEFSKSQLVNPAGSGILVACTRIDLLVDPVSVVQLEIDTTLFSGAVSGLFRDSRFGVPRATAAQVASESSVVAVGGGLRLLLQQDENFSIRDDNGIVVLTPGTVLNVGSTSAAIKLLVNYFWRERIAEPSEINF